MFIPTSLKTTANDVLGTVSSAAHAVSHTANAVSNLAEAGSIVTADYRDTVADDLASNRVRRNARLRHERALDDARFYFDLQKSLGSDAELKRLYNEALNEYVEASPKLTAVPTK